MRFGRPRQSHDPGIQQEPAVNAERARFLDVVESIGRRLCRDAIWYHGCCSWLGWATLPGASQQTFAVRAMGPDFYSGTSGIGLFLARLALVTRDPIVRVTAEAALAHALTAVDKLASRREYGFYFGLSGIGWACREAGLLLETEELVSRGEVVLHAAAAISPRPERIDLISGSAGLVPALLDVAAGNRCGKLRAIAVQHGEHLLAIAERNERGWSWNTVGRPQAPHLLGLAHGASGIACALAALASSSKREDFLDGARQALRYERSHFHAAEGNWPDLRSFAQPVERAEPPCMTAWCHGAPGIGLARLYVHQFFPEEPVILDEAEIAIATTAAALEGTPSWVNGNNSLCHGASGNADLLVLADDLLDRPGLRRKAEAVGMIAAEKFEESRGPWPCGIRGAGETPNLLLGLAGIGYFFLRLYDSETTPTVLLPAWRPIIGRGERC